MGKYGLLGQVLGHSRSPQIHALLGSVPYGLYECEPDGVEEFLRTTDLCAMNVTIPYKKTVMPYCVKIHGAAERIGSVNTLVRKEDGWHGYNTDYDGLCYLLREGGITLQGKKVLILGSGGAGVMARTVAEDMGAREIVTVSRSGEDNYENLQKHADGEIILNTTPVGMYPNNGQSPISLEQFPHCEGVADLIYNPLKTALVLQAEAKGISAVGGLMMLVAQAKSAAEHFMGKTLDDALVPAITKRLQRDMRNIILIGMPGSGKSTVATALGERLGLPVLDSDAEIVQRAGMSIPEIFAKEGEDGFRRQETFVLQNLGKQTGVILSTGGGCVVQQENFSPLRQNGIGFWICRDLDLLPTEGRPLSQITKLETMYEARRPLYKHFSHHVIDNNGTLEETVTQILEVLG